MTPIFRRVILLLKRQEVLKIMAVIAVLAIGLSVIAFGYAQCSQVLAIQNFQFETSITYISQFGLNFSWVLGNIFIAIGILICFFGIARIFIGYKIGFKNFAKGKVTITFDLSTWKRVLLLNIPPNWGRLKAQISYRNTDDSFPIDCLWGGKEEWIYVNEAIDEKLQTWYEDKNGNLFRLDSKKRLPDKLEFEIRLIKRDKHIMKRYPHTFEKGHN